MAPIEEMDESPFDSGVWYTVPWVGGREDVGWLQRDAGATETQFSLFVWQESLRAGLQGLLASQTPLESKSLMACAHLLAVLGALDAGKVSS